MTAFLRICIGALAISMLAQVEIVLPISETGIPITGQTLAVLAVGFLFGFPEGLLAVLLYLLLGGIGLPAFAGGASGWATFTGNTGGFLYGFIPAAVLAGGLADRGWRSSFPKLLLGMLVGTLIILFCGWLQLALIFDAQRALAYGVTPFLAGAAVKIVLGALIVWIVEKYNLKYPTQGMNQKSN